MSTRVQIINGPNIFDVSGHYFELQATVNPVDVRLFAADGRVLADERGQVAGFVHDRRGGEGFTRVEITTSALESVKFYFSDGYSGTKSVAATVSSTVYPAGNNHVQAAATVTNASGALLAANANRRYLMIQNQDPAGSIYVRTDGGGAATATAACVLIGPGQAWEPAVPPLGALTAIGDFSSNANIMVIEA